MIESRPIKLFRDGAAQAVHIPAEFVGTPRKLGRKWGGVPRDRRSAVQARLDLLTAYLLDTNVLSDLIRHPTGRVRRRLGTLEASVIVACELRFGALKKGSKRLSQMVDDLLREIMVHPFPREAAYDWLGW